MLYIKFKLQGNGSKMPQRPHDLQQKMSWMRKKLGLELVDEQPPPTYELALKMITKESTIGNMPNATYCWMEASPNNAQVVPGYGLPLSCQISDGNISATHIKN